LVKDDHENVSVILSLVLSAESRPTVTCIGKEASSLIGIKKSLLYEFLDFPFIVNSELFVRLKKRRPKRPTGKIEGPSLSVFLLKRLTVPSFSVIFMNISTEVPTFFPSFSLIATSASKRIVTLIASIFESLIVLVTGEALVTLTPTPSSLSISLIAFIKV